MKRIQTLFLGALLLFVGVDAHAYGVVSERAVRLDAIRTLYVMTYDFGFLNAELYMPMGMTREGRGATSTRTAMYTLVREDGAVYEGGISRAVVVTTAEVRGNTYYVPKGRRAEFTLIALVDTAAETTRGGTIHMRLTELPLTIIRSKDLRELLPLGADELVQFRTTGIAL